MLVHAQSGDAAFAACLRLFRQYPLAVRRHYAEHRYGSMVLMNRGAGTARFFVLIMEWDDLFVLRHWDRRDGVRVEIGACTAVTDDVRWLIETSVPVPRDGALLGWLSGHQVQAVVAAYGRLPEPWDDASAVPGVLVMPRSGSQPAEWPPLTASPLDDGQLWEFVGSGQLADLSPLVSRSAGQVFWVPGTDGRTAPQTARRTAPQAASQAASQAAPQAGARVLVTERLSGDELWLPAGVYTDHRALRDGIPARTASQLLAQPGVVDLAGGRGSQQLLGV